MVQTETHLGPDVTRLKQNAQVKLLKMFGSYFCSFNPTRTARKKGKTKQNKKQNKNRQTNNKTKQKQTNKQQNKTKTKTDEQQQIVYYFLDQSLILE